MVQVLKLDEITASQRSVVYTMRRAVLSSSDEGTSDETFVIRNVDTSISVVISLMFDCVYTSSWYLYYVSTLHSLPCSVSSVHITEMD